MKPFIKAVLPYACAALLASCGGGGPDPAMAPQTTLLATVQQTSSQVVTDYYPVVQRLYVAYFGRPADPAGLAYYAQRYMEERAPTDVGGVSQAYGVNVNLTALIDSFGTSAESQALYPGDNDTFVNAIYRNLFSRDAEPAGKAFWVGNINSGAMTRAHAALAIMAGAQSTDLDLVNKKHKVATDFTNSLDTPAELAAYDGLAANAVVRTMLAGVGPGTDVNNFQGTIDSTIASLVGPPQVSFTQVRAIINQRCVGCHSANPTIPGFNTAPFGITFDTEAQIRAHAADIYQNAVVTQFMPFGNMTGMTDAERALIGTWFNQGMP